MIETKGLTKAYRTVLAVDDLSVTVTPGAVTGFLGPNGAGKSTTMRMLLGLDRPTRGSCTIGGKPYAEHRWPLREVGALLDPRAFAAGRSPAGHLRALAAASGVRRARVDEVLAMVGLQDVADRRAGGFSLGMGQRLGIATALLGDPHTLVLDEPVNGLDPEGVLWLRTLLRDLAAEGRTVLLSSHLMSEMALTAERLVIVGRGRLIAETTVEAVVAQAGGGVVRVVTPRAELLAGLLRAQGASVAHPGPGVLEVTGRSAEQVGGVAAEHGVVLHELVAVRPSLEQAFMDLTRDAVAYRATDQVSA